MKISRLEVNYKIKKFILFSLAPKPTVKFSDLQKKDRLLIDKEELNQLLLGIKPSFSMCFDESAQDRKKGWNLLFNFINKNNVDRQTKKKLHILKHAKEKEKLKKLEIIRKKARQIEILKKEFENAIERIKDREAHLKIQEELREKEVKEIIEIERKRKELLLIIDDKLNTLKKSYNLEKILEEYNVPRKKH